MSNTTVATATSIVAVSKSTGKSLAANLKKIATSRSTNKEAALNHKFNRDLLAKLVANVNLDDFEFGGEELDDCTWIDETTPLELIENRINFYLSHQK